MRSMTGYGVGEAVLGGGRVLAEMRSLNHRFLEVRVRMPSEISEHAFFVEQLCREKLVRGRYDVVVRYEAADTSPPRIDLIKARKVYATLAELRDELAPGTELPLSVLASIPNLLIAPTHFEPEQVRAALTDALAGATITLDTMRETEGLKLAAELDSRLASAQELRSKILKLSVGLLSYYRNRLQERLDKLLSDSGVPIDHGRLEAEVAIMADRSDITEELVRLESHFDQFAALLRTREPVGRRLDFLLQEVGRESNTIGAKCQDASLSHLVVELKAEVERMREQVQNVE